MRLDDLCDETVKEVRGCLGCAAVDLETGLPLAMKVVPGSLLTAEAMEAMAVASVDYFRNRTIWQLEMEMSGGAGESPESFVREIQTTTEDTYHFMAVVPGWEGTLLILITDKTANLGMGWVSMRQALERIREMREREQREAPAAALPPPLEPSQDPGQGAPALQSIGGGGVNGSDGPSRTTPPSPPEHPAPGDLGPDAGRQPPLRTPDLPNPQWRGGHGVRRGPLNRI